MVRILTPDDAEAYFELRREALLDSPLAFASSPEDDVAFSPDSIREQLRSDPSRSVILGAFREELVGAAGLVRDRHAKCAHKALLWVIYVTPERHLVLKLRPRSS